MRRDHADDMIAAHPGLRALARASSSAARQGELAGERAAAAMFREVRGGQTVSHRRSRRHRPRPYWRSALVGSTSVLVLSGGFAAASYAAALPVPVQHFAHRLLGFAGVPDSGSPPRSAPHAGPVSSRHARPGHGGPGTAPEPGSSSAPSPRQSPSPSPGTTRAPVLTAHAGRSPVAAGAAVVVIAQLTDHGRPVAHASLGLAERKAGTTSWLPAGSAVTDENGLAKFVVPDVTSNADFQVSGPDGVKTGQLSVVVIPPVDVSVTQSGKGAARTVLVSCSFAHSGDVAWLQVLSAGTWQNLHAKRLDHAGQATFALTAQKTAVSYRFVLPGTALHGQSVSLVITVPARHPSNGKKGTA